MTSSLQSPPTDDLSRDGIALEAIRGYCLQHGYAYWGRVIDRVLVKHPSPDVASAPQADVDRLQQVIADAMRDLIVTGKESTADALRTAYAEILAPRFTFKPQEEGVTPDSILALHTVFNVGPMTRKSMMEAHPRVAPLDIDPTGAG